MLPIFTAEQTRLWDKFTIENEHIASVDLMERAAQAFYHWFSTTYDSETPVIVLCGTGNNGGDGLAIARLLHYNFYNVQVRVCKISQNESADFQKNLAALPQRAEILAHPLSENDVFPSIPPDSVVVDAILGSGLSRAVEGYWASFFDYLNQLPNDIISVDMPSGLFSDKSSQTPSVSEAPKGIICAKNVVIFQTPKLALLMSENQDFVQNFVIKPIGLNPGFSEQTQPSHFYLTADTIQKMLKPRPRHGHKGTFGHALLVAGSFGMAGAAVLAARACMRSGVGLLTIHSPQSNRLILQTAVPEAKVRTDADEFVVSQNSDTLAFDAVGIGCGMGKAGRTASALKNYLLNTEKPMVIDADALNLIADNPDMLNAIPKGSILTPHPKEFERLFGKTKNDFDRLEILKISAKSLKVNILLKGAYTAIADTEGVVFFNSTGNAGMATAGSGDVLTGILTAFLAQGYEAAEAAKIGVFLHGLAGDLAAEKMSQEALMASDIVAHLGEAFLSIRK